MDKPNKKINKGKKSNSLPFNNDQLGENASEEYSNSYKNVGKDCGKGNQ